jgi:CheY-like chemotaxis protein
MEQVVINLVMNAAEAIENQRGTIRVRTALEPIAESNRGDNVLGYPLAADSYAVLEVTDTGSGMDEDTQTQIFDPFFTTKFTGRGLGLAAVQGIVRSLGGGIQVRSKAGDGSCFRVLLPVRCAAARRHIVVVEDDENTPRTTAALLRDAGHEVTACMPARALEIFASKPSEIDLVLLDGDMPGSRDLLTRLRGLSESAVVAILTSDHGQSGMEGIEMIQKPFQAASVHRLLNGQGRDGAAA